MPSPTVILYSTSLHAWEVWQNGRPAARGSLEACQAEYPAALPVSERQRGIALRDLLDLGRQRTVDVRVSRRQDVTDPTPDPTPA